MTNQQLLATLREQVEKMSISENCSGHWRNGYYVARDKVLDLISNLEKSV